jgi:hypothetical protein
MTLWYRPYLGFQSLHLPPVERWKQALNKAVKWPVQFLDITAYSSHMEA